MLIEKSVNRSLLLNHTTKQKIEQRSEILQFLPESLEELVNKKTINYNSKNLKTSYIIDIIHNLIFKYYYKGDNLFTLNATVLKEKYTKNYHLYINYLVNNNYLILTKDYSVGKSSRIYSLNLKLLNGKIKRYINNDTILLKKYRSNLLDMVFDQNNIIEREVKEKLINDLYSVDIKMESVIYFLDRLEDNDTNIYNKNMYSSESIKSGNIFYHFDRFGRMHTNFTTLKSFIRKNCLTIDGEETIEFDVKNSQPLFLCKLIEQTNTKWVDSDELDFFRSLTINGKYYDYIVNRFGIKDRKVAKTMTYEVLFGKNDFRNKSDKLFKSCFPTIYNFIKLYKKQYNDYRILSYHLQRSESNFIFNKVVKTINNLYPHIKIITVHDSIMVNRKYKQIVSDIFESKLTEEFK
jgi:hypothetical protein